MMDCSTTRDWILEVDPEELKRDGTVEQRAGNGDQQGTTGTHAAHLASCPECRTLADEILGAEAVLREGLDSLGPTLDVGAALVRARQAHQTTRRRRRWQAALPLAAAALGGVLLMNRSSPAPAPGFDPATVRAARALGLVGARPVVRAERHGRVAVLPTGNPNITIIWFME